MTTEYSLIWKRSGYKPKRMIFKSRKGAERRMRLLGPEPWTAIGKDPEELYCCSGRQCGCGGLTTRAAMLAERANMPMIEYLRFETREVIASAWEEVDAK